MLQRVINRTDVFTLAKQMHFGDIHLKSDRASQLRAVIAIHNTKLGPALGGCRFVEYENSEAAIYDAMRLAQGMSYKAAIAGIAQGGGKSVIMKPATLKNREALFEAFGRFVDELGGRYITAVDSGTSVADMDIIARCTQYVVSTSAHAGGSGDPSPYTAHGVLKGIQSAVKFKLGRDDLHEVHVAVQGAGNVGFHLCKALYENGARLTICDNKSTAAQRIAEQFNAAIVGKEEIFDVDCDVFAPCARGGIINRNVVSRLKSSIVAGAANNQLEDDEIATMLHQKQILYAPDYVINAGGLIQVSLDDEKEITQKIASIYDNLLNIFARSVEENLPTSVIANTIAQERLDNAR